MSADLSFEVVDARAEPYAAVPTLLFRLRITESTGRDVNAAILRGQVRIEPQRRRYSAEEEERLLELFGETPRWGDTLRPFLWTHVGVNVGRFRGTTEIDLPMPCSYDFDVAAAKYLHALGDGEIPVIVLFNGTVFSRDGDSHVVEPVSWSEEASYRLPVATWRALMDQYFPDSGWLRLGRSTLDDLSRFKAEQALPTFEQAVNALLKQAGESR